MDFLVSVLFFVLAASQVVLSSVQPGGHLNSCSTSPCQNGGICSTNGTSKFTCQCYHGFTGQSCDIKPSDCSPTLCVNGVCRKDSNGKPTCYCTQGFSGYRCEMNQDECASSPCRHGGLCVDGINGYRCSCKKGFYGLHCELKEEQIQKCVKSCSGGLCWRNESKVISLAWGYGESICNTQESCFGSVAVGPNHTVNISPDEVFLEVQLRPQQLQVGDSLNFTLDENMAPYVRGLRPYVADKNVFLTCIVNASKNTYVVSEPQKYVITEKDLLTEGVHYFIDNVDMTFRCEFGLRVNVSVKTNKCYEPNSIKQCSGHGQCATYFSQSAYHCRCCGGFRGEFCEKLDHCYSKPCKNQAVCQNTDDDKLYKCHCVPGYEGKHCSRVIDMCASNPCQNNAPCTPLLNDYSCACSKGFAGKTCDVEVNECDSSPCVNGGTCLDNRGSFQCLCLSGFTGYHCEVNINDCASNPCQHGTCIDQVNRFRCYCKPGYGGITCGLNLNECLSNPCFNGGYCVDEINDFRCDCGHGYRGKLCEEDVDLCKEENWCVNSLSCKDEGHSVKCVCKPGFIGANCGINVHDCEPNPCQNGGTCRDKVNDFQCFCPPGLTGKTCEVTGPTVPPSLPDVQDFMLRILTDDCHLLKDSVLLHDILLNITKNVANACKCDFNMNHVDNDSVTLVCLDSISGKLSMPILPVKDHTFEELQCLVWDYLSSHKNVIELGHDTFITGLFGDLVSQCKKSSVDSASDKVLETSTNLAVTIGSLCAVLGLVVAAVVVCCKCRRARPPVKHIKSSKEDDIIDHLSDELMAAIAPTPKSMYRTSGGYHNVAFSGRFNPENPIQSRKV